MRMLLICVFAFGLIGFTSAWSQDYRDGVAVGGEVPEGPLGQDPDNFPTEFYYTSIEGYCYDTYVSVSTYAYQNLRTGDDLTTQTSTSGFSYVRTGPSYLEGGWDIGAQSLDGDRKYFKSVTVWNGAYTENDPISTTSLYWDCSGRTGGEPAAFELVTGGGEAARFEVSKNFDDGNPVEVAVTISCNTGLPLEQSTEISEGDGVTFVVVSFDDAELDCTVSEAGVEGYTAVYSASGGTSTDDGCAFENLVGGARVGCTIQNQLDPVTVEVTKEWFDVGAVQAPLDTYAEADWSCSPVATIDGGGEQVGSVVDTDSGTLYFSGTTDTESFQVLPHYDGTTCTVDEDVSDSSIESDDSACQQLEVFPGGGAECTITNTRFFEGIPSLDGRGLAVLAVLLLGFGLYGVRRFI